VSYQPAETWSFAFAQPDGELFATATVWDGGSCSTFGTPLRAEGAGPAEEWRLTGDGVALTFAPVGEPAELELADAGITTLYQLARVQGTLSLDGGEREVDCPGQRTRRLGILDPKRFAALRAVSGWFGDADGVAVLAARPRKARGHDSELLDAVLLDDGVPVHVSEPRLSSTYTAAGVPARVGLELWLGEEDDADQYARRAAAEAIGRAAACPDPQLRAELLRWRMQGRVGVGVYELLETR
jgi:hypothetical protein